MKHVAFICTVNCAKRTVPRANIDWIKTGGGNPLQQVTPFSAPAAVCRSQAQLQTQVHVWLLLTLWHSGATCPRDTSGSDPTWFTFCKHKRAHTHTFVHMASYISGFLKIVGQTFYGCMGDLRVDGNLSTADSQDPLTDRNPNSQP